MRFVLSDVDPVYDDAVASLAFAREGDRYVRRFPADSRHLDAACRNFPKYVEEIVLQAARVRLAPWDAALGGLLDRVDGRGIDWWLGGSAALAVRGVDVAPRDIDIVTDAGGAAALADLFADVLVEPLTYSPDWVAEWWARAFLGARVEWIGGVRKSAEAHPGVDFGPSVGRRVETVMWEGRALRVPPLDVQLAAAELRGLAERAAAIRAALARPDGERRPDGGDRHPREGGG